MEKLAYWAVGGLIVLLMIVAPLLILWRKRANATKAHVKSETQPARLAVRAQASQAQSTAPKSDLLEERSAVDVAAGSQDAAVADAIPLQNGKKQKQDINNESGSQKHEAQLVAVNDKKDDGAQPPAADVIACAHCDREISKNDNFCMHCGASVAVEKRAAKTRLCSSCRQEIGTSDKFCRHCGASSLAISAPSMNGSSASPDRVQSVGHHGRVDEVVPSTRTSVKKKRAPR
jgi:RNA polymerase subunit RPABC4/transcription elongation factor Spt4